MCKMLKMQFGGCNFHKNDVYLFQEMRKGALIMAKRITNKNYFYRFADGFAVWSAGLLPVAERVAYVKAHGAIVELTAC